MGGVISVGFEEVIDKITDGISANVPVPDSEYVGEDGFLHCSKCHAKVQTEVEFLNIKKVVRCICDCKRKELDAFKERERQQERERKRKICFSETNMWSWTFENDDRKNERLSNAMQRYVNNFTQFLKEGKGLLLYGPVGTGKTYYAAAIANALIDLDYSCKMTSFSEVTKRIQGMFDGKQEYIESLNRYSLLIFDDLGTERKTEFMQEMVFDILEARYKSGLPFIVTTNLSAETIKKPQEVEYQRIYDRILERCFPVEVTGTSRRREKVKDTFFDTKAILGL